MKPPEPLDLRRLKVFPLEQRRSLTSVEDVLISPRLPPPRISESAASAARSCAGAIRRAREREAGVILMYGAHLLRNGAALLLDELMGGGWLTHLATNGAGTIHDWEYAWLGRSTESVQENVAAGTFGTWDETGRNIHLALMAGSLDGLGYGRALGQFIAQDGAVFPDAQQLRRYLAQEPEHPLAPARAEVLRAMTDHAIPSGRLQIVHRWKHASILASAVARNVPVTVHPGIGYDIVSCHPMFNGGIIGRAAEIDFKWFAGSVDRLDGGVVLSVGSAIMAPQVFEKSLSCVHNIRFQQGRPPVHDLSVFIVDLQDGGGWNWSQGEPPRDHPAYYLRFCKSFSRMGGAMTYVQCHNAAFLHHLHHELHRS